MINENGANNLVFDNLPDSVIKISRYPITKRGKTPDLAQTIYSFVSRKDKRDKLAKIDQWGIVEIKGQYYFWVKQEKWSRPLTNEELTGAVLSDFGELVWDTGSDNFGVFDGEIKAVDYFDQSLSRTEVNQLAKEILYLIAQDKRQNSPSKMPPLEKV